MAGMATWQDGPEYAPVVPPSEFLPPDGIDRVEGTATVVLDPPTQPPGGRPQFSPPAEVVAPLGDLVPEAGPTRDPRAPFSVRGGGSGLPGAPSLAGGSAWRATHGRNLPDAPAPPSAPAPAPEPAPPYPGPAQLPPIVPHPDLDAREQATLWLLLPPALFVLGAFTGPWVVAFVLAGAAVVATRPTVLPAAATLSRTVAGLLLGLFVLTLLVGQSWDLLAGLGRVVGMVYGVVCATWFVRERSAVEAERRRRDTPPTTWAPPDVTQRQNWPPPSDFHRDPQDRP